MSLRIQILYPDPFVPFAYMKDLKPKGLVIERLSSPLERVGVLPEFIPNSHEDIIEKLKNGRGDLIACLAVNEERQRSLLFSDAIVQTGGALFCPKEVSPSDDPGTFSGGIIATPGSGPLAGLIAEKWPEVQVLRVKNYPDALSAVLNGSAQTAALNLHYGWDIIQKMHPGCFHKPEKPFVSMALSAAGLLGHSESFIEKINQALYLVE